MILRSTWPRCMLLETSRRHAVKHMGFSHPGARGMFVRPTSSPGVLPSAQPTNIEERLQNALRILQQDLGGDQVWTRRIKEALLDLQPRPRRIGVYGDALARPQDVVSALLQTPFESAANRAVLEREPEVLHEFCFDREVSRRGDTTLLPSSFLEAADAHLYEIRGGDVISSLLRSDYSVIVIDPYRLLDTPAIQQLPQCLIRSSMIVVNGSVPTSRDDIRKLINRPVSFTDAARAISAHKALAEHPDQYQQLFLASGIGDLQSGLTRSNTTIRTLEAVIEHITKIVSLDINSTQDIVRSSRALKSAATAATEQAEHLSVVARNLDGGVIEGGPVHAEHEARTALRILFEGRLTWLSLMFRLRIDEIAEEVHAVIQNSFSGLERQLIYEAGKVAQVQSALSKTSDDVLRQAPAPFQSAILLNRLSTLSLSVPEVKTGTLIEPIISRRQRLYIQAVQLQSSAKRILFQSSLVTLGGALLSWLACVPPLEIISGNTAMASGALLVSLSIAYGQWRWQRKQRAFWQVWERTVHLLGHDVKSVYASTMSTMVTAKPFAASEGLEQLAKRRMAHLAEIQARVEQI